MSNLEKIDLKNISTQDLFHELNNRELEKMNLILIDYRNGMSIKGIKNKYGCYGIEIIIQNLALSKISIPEKLWDLYLN